LRFRPAQTAWWRFNLFIKVFHVDYAAMPHQKTLALSGDHEKEKA
jgi:hypothetical protein